MHRSRIGALFIDHRTSSFAKSWAFWAAATGRPMEEPADSDDPYRALGLFDGSLLVEMQHVGEGTKPRVHIDIDIDDVDAEVRLEQLGATRLQSCDNGRFWQMADPEGIGQVWRDSSHGYSRGGLLPDQ